MDHNERSLRSLVPGGLQLVPIHPTLGETPLAICVLLQADPEPGSSAFVVIRDVPGSRVYLGAVCDAAARVQEWLEIWVQEPQMNSGAASGREQPLDNSAFDQRWRAEGDRARLTLPELVIVTGMEERNPSPILIKRSTLPAVSPLARVEPAQWQLCKDDDFLKSLGLPVYSSSAHRYLHEPAPKAKEMTVIATAPDAPSNAHVHGLETLVSADNITAIFNPHAGLVRVTRFTPLDLEDYLQLLEGRVWDGPALPAAQSIPALSQAALQDWSLSATGWPFLLRPKGASAERLHEVFFLKLAALLGLLKQVRDYIKAHQLPLLNLSPGSFRVSVPDSGGPFPAFWAAKFILVRPSQACWLKVRFTDRKYFVRLGRPDPSPFLPEGFGAHSFGIGSIRIRNVISQDDGVVLEGTLVTEDYLKLDPNDLIWFKLPLGEERLEFFAQVFPTEMAGPKEARFRTIPAEHPDKVVAELKRAAGTAFQRSPYEIWPLLSSSCDLFSLGVLGTRILLANSQSNLPVILDDILSLAQHCGKSTDPQSVQSELRLLAARDQRVLDLISPHALNESEDSPEQARAKVPMDLWFEAVALVLRLFPGIGPQSFCQGPGDVAPDALHTVFEQPIQELETLVIRLRTALLPSLAANEEIAGVVLDELTSGTDGDETQA